MFKERVIALSEGVSINTLKRYGQIVLHWRSLDRAISSTENNFNAIRLVLASFVIYFHGFGMVDHPSIVDPIQRNLFPVGADIGGTAVDMFFLISGLFVSQSYFRDQNILAFAIKRILRIYPGLFVCVSVTALIAVILEQPGSIISYLGFPDFWRYITNNAVLDLTWTLPGIFESHQNQAINGPLHTLPREVAMYVCLAVSLGFFGKRFVAFGFGALGFVLMASFFPTLSNWLRIPEQAYVQALCFFAGVVLFSIARFVRLNALVVLGAIGMHAIAPDAIAHFTFLVALSCLLVWVACLPKMPFFKGDYSYGVYIYGWPTQQFLLSLWSDWNPFLHCLAAFILALGLAMLSWRRIESPAIAFGKSVSRLAKSGSILSVRQFDWVGTKGGKTLYALLILFAGFHLLGQFTQHHLGPAVQPLEVGALDYGPRQAVLGEAFNPQPDGSSALWVAYDIAPPEGATIVLEGRRLNTIIRERLATALVPNHLINAPGELSMYLEYRSPTQWMQSERYEITIQPRPLASAALPSDAAPNVMAILDLGGVNYGPQRARIGEGFNVQPDGRSALWITYERTPPEGTQIVFEGRALPTNLGAALATAIIPEDLIATPGDKQVYLEFRSERHWLRSESVVLTLSAGE